MKLLITCLLFVVTGDMWDESRKIYYPITDHRMLVALSVILTVSLVLILTGDGGKAERIKSRKNWVIVLLAFAFLETWKESERIYYPPNELWWSTIIIFVSLVLLIGNWKDE
jgi:predicted membrane protein